jgi:hypothetical protein
MWSGGRESNLHDQLGRRTGRLSDQATFVGHKGSGDRDLPRVTGYRARFGHVLGTPTRMFDFDRIVPAPTHKFLTDPARLS